MPLPEAMTSATSARIGTGRAGGGQTTAARLALAAAHAEAKDAVLSELDDAIEGLPEGIEVIRSKAGDREEYLRRPDLGRLPDPGDLAGLEPEPADIGVVFGDGLSPAALEDHAGGVWEAIHKAVPDDWTLAAPVLALGARVALADHIGEAKQWRTVIMAIGERPGLSVPRSIGLYITHAPRPGMNDGMRNCISNVHSPNGLLYDDAAARAIALIGQMRELGMSGTAIKDASGETKELE
ncbi:ethanolamine ammonia-lyase subunit EutC [Corynebacterium sp. NPDC060344]|uniref:ethanolamine ammonia-lyase subunit EutC n=1 Tax=Corynebacterium sp. NPDC060344 TaxID=3347101 RepID=UPI00365C9CFA